MKIIEPNMALVPYFGVMRFFFFFSLLKKKNETL